MSHFDACEHGFPMGECFSPSCEGARESPDPVDDYYEPLTHAERDKAVRGRFPPYGEMLSWIRRWEATARAAEGLDWLQQFHDAGFTHLWYAHPGGTEHNRFGKRWHAGMWTGPDGDLICVRPCETSVEAERCLSPGADTPAAAVQAALELKGRIEQEDGDANT
jgi:hypothetical protein